MPRRRHGEMPLPHGWDVAHDFDGKLYFIDHILKKTTWIDPRDRFTKPQTFADCIGNELPLGWEEAYDPQVGVYYINHVNQCTQLEDPRLEWRAIQEAMLRDYLQTAQDALEAKKEMVDVKQQRLHLAQDEFQHLNNALTNLNTLNASRTSLCSSTSSTRYDPNALKTDVAHAQARVAQLKRELEQLRGEMRRTQKGLETLTSVEQKIGNDGFYNLTEAQAIVAELNNIQQSLSSGEKERAELMHSLAKLKDDLTRLQLAEESPDLSTLSLPQEKLSTASQTELSGELGPAGTRLAEMARTRLHYDEARKRVQLIQRKLADLEEKMSPCEMESDKDRLLLFQEKEQLLRELRSMAPRGRSAQEMTDIQDEVRRLELDLNHALQLNNRAITDRVRLHEEKQLLLQQLCEALRAMTSLESQLKTLSASTLSVSSSSSLGSLSTSSSKGSLSSGLSFTDIYGNPQLAVAECGTRAPAVDMADLHKRVERLLCPPNGGSPQPSLSPRSSLSSVSPPVSPLYDPILKQNKLPFPYEPVVPDTGHIYDNLPLRSGYSGNGADPLYENIGLGAPGLSGPPPRYDARSLDASVLEERLSKLGLCEARGVARPFHNLSQGSGLGRPQLDPPLSPISETPPDHNLELLQVVSAASASSGSNTRSVSAAVSDESVAGDSGVFEASKLHHPNLEAAQLQIRLRYVVADGLLFVGIERARNLSVLCVPPDAEVLIKGALLPPGLGTDTCCTRSIADLRKAYFGETFPMSVPVNKLTSKTLQVYVWCHTNHAEECLGCTQVSLADFNPETISLRWYNILSFNLLQPSRPVASSQAIDAVGVGVVEDSANAEAAEGSRRREESSDDSQASTLTKVPAMADEVAQCCDLLDALQDVSVDKETNTECVFPPERGRAGDARLLSSGAIKRSQTFSPSAAHQYICRLNRSDSDSSMPLYRRAGGPFQRDAAERRSLRWRVPAGEKPRAPAGPSVPRTSLDLELDRRAQLTRLESQQAELDRLRKLKCELESVRERGDAHLASAILEDAQFQNLMAVAESVVVPKSAEDKRVDKMLKKTGRELYKLRKSKIGHGKPDVVSFKEKMAFFTRPELGIPDEVEEDAPLPLDSMELRSESSTLTRGEKLPADGGNEPEGSSSDEGGDEDSRTVEGRESPANQRFDYVVDRTLGVQV